MSGMIFRRAEMTTLEPTSTKVRAAPMPRLPRTVTDTASTEQQPSTSFKTGFSLNRPFTNIFQRFFIRYFPSFCSASKAERAFSTAVLTALLE